MDTVDRQAVWCRFRFPVSGHVVALRYPTGVEDLLLVEGGSDPTEVAMALAGHLARPSADAGIDWRQLTVTDLDALILRLRQAVIGDRVRADVVCRAGGCGQRIDISFGIADYLAYRTPRPPRIRGAWAVEPDAESGWFQLTAVRKKTDGTDAVSFRLPTVADQLAVAGAHDGVEELARRCIRPSGVPSRLRRLVEEAMETMAPSLASDLRGTCPECGAEVVVYFDARQFCLRELKQRAAFVYQDIDLLARRYHWSETEILAIPNYRRTNYAELARQEAL